MPGGYVCSATLKAKASAPSVREVALGELLDSEALLEGAAHVLLRACTGRARAERALRPRPDLRPEAELRAEGARAADGRGALVLPRRLPDPRAVDEVHRDECVPGRSRGSSVSRRQGRDPERATGDEDEGGAHVTSRSSSAPQRPPSGSPGSGSRTGSPRPTASAGCRAQAPRLRPSACARGGAGSTS